MNRAAIEELLYGKADQERRFTQDFPILPDVWIEYGETPAAAIELLLTPHNDFDAPSCGRMVRERLRGDTLAAPAAPPNVTDARPRVLSNESVVLATLTLPQ